MGKIMIAILPDTYASIQRHAGGGLFKGPPVYKTGKYFIDVDGEVIQALNRYRIKNNLKNYDETIMQIILEHEQESNVPEEYPPY